MGFPISDYNILKKLIGNKNFTDAEYLKVIFDKFNIYGFIIHDPEIHKEFDLNLNRNFDKLDYLTGDKFLFFALTSPSKSMVEILIRRGYSMVIENLFRSSFYIKQPELDESITAYTISQALNIDFDDLPVIIISRDLSFDSYFVIKTDSKILEEQLTEIGYIVKRIDEKSNDMFYLMGKDKNLFPYYNIASSYDSLGKVLSDFMAFTILKEGVYTEKDILEEQIKETLTGLINYIRKEKQEEKILKFKGLLLTYLSNIVDERDNNFLDIDVLCEQESKLSYRTFRRVFYKSFNIIREIIQSPYGNGDTDIDYSIFMVPLCKIFEIEINLSVVHWIRNLLNIEMPDYFKKVKPIPGNYTITPSNELVPNPNPVDFNMGRNHKWIPPKLGESELVCKTLYTIGRRPEEINNFDALLNHWGVIRKYRNMAAHTQILNRDDFNTFYNVFTIIRNNFLSQMNRLKLRMKYGNI